MKAVWLGRLSDANVTKAVVPTALEILGDFCKAVIQAFVY